MKEVVLKYLSLLNDGNFKGLDQVFSKDAKIIWKNTKEEFNVEELIDVNTRYPGIWSVSPVELFQIEDQYLSIALIEETTSKVSLYMISKYQFQNQKIQELVEYFSDNGEAPEWRRK